MTITGRWIVAFAMLSFLSTATFAAAQNAPRGRNEGAALRGWDTPRDSIWLDTLDLAPIEQGQGKPDAGRSQGDKRMSLGGQACVHGVSTQAPSKWVIDLKGGAEEFVALVGVDDETEGKGSVEFEVWVDDKKVASSDVMKGKAPPKLLKADLKDAKQLKLLVTDAGDGTDGDYADWGGAHIRLKKDGEKPSTVGSKPIPPPAISMEISPKPAINGPRVYGSTPGRPFLFLVPVSGQRPIEYSAENLPAGLTIDSKSGIISGSLKSEGETEVTLKAKNALGEAARKFKIVGGKSKLALTPPMGWNSWNCWARAVSDEKVRYTADVFMKSGLAEFGYSFINIDDCWQGKRDESGEILPNEKFPDMKALTEYIHAKGLKAGIYSSPGPTSCGGYAGSYQHEAQDAVTYAKWGFDYLKYDWCSMARILRNPTLEEKQKPFLLMRDSLDKTDRDIVYSLCNYGENDVWKWGAEVGGNLWRTTGDIQDSWQSLRVIGFDFQYRGQNKGFGEYAQPGHWNDPDMLIVGKIGWGPQLHPCSLTPHEQVTHISLWCLQAAPLLIGCDLSDIDPFTLAILTNPEILAIDQDQLGKAANRLVKQGRAEIWARPLADGTMAVGLFNMNIAPETIEVKWDDLKLSGKQPVRDLWQRKDLEPAEGSFKTVVQPHGCVVVKIGQPKAE